MPARDRRQTLLFSATFPPALQAVARRSYLRPTFASVAVGRVGASNASVEQRVVACLGDGTKRDKLDTMLPLLLRAGDGGAVAAPVAPAAAAAAAAAALAEMERTIIFCNKKRVATWVAKVTPRPRPC